MSAYIGDIVDNDTFPLSIAQTHAFNTMQSLNEILASTDRVLNTPLPVAYQIAISQITWLYVITLPFQLVGMMGWVTVPMCACAAYIILGIAAIGHEIENPFGQEVNDLPIELYCAQIASDVLIIASKPQARACDHYQHPGNKTMYPISSAGYSFWIDKGEEEIRDALEMRASISKSTMWKHQVNWAGWDSPVSAAGDTNDEDNCKAPKVHGHWHRTTMGDV